MKVLPVFFTGLAEEDLDQIDIRMKPSQGWRPGRDGFLNGVYPGPRPEASTLSHALTSACSVQPAN